MPLAFFKFDLDEKVLHWVHHGGPPVLFLVLLTCGLGMPLPEDLPLLAAGGMIATGRMNLAVAAVCAWAGIIGGDCILYSLGRAFGAEVSKIPFIGRHISEERMRRAEKLFERWGVWVVAVGRMFAGIRGTMVVVAGASRFTFWKFLIADSLAAVVSGGLFLYLGYVFGGHLHLIIDKVKHAKQWVMLGVVGLAFLIVIFIWIRKFSSQHLHQKNTAVPEAPPPSNAATQGEK